MSPIRNGWSGDPCVAVRIGPLHRDVAALRAIAVRSSAERDSARAKPPTAFAGSFSKKLENHVHAVALFFTFYNFCRVHQTLRVTPAMEAGIADHVWTVEELIGLVQEEDVVILK